MMVAAYRSAVSMRHKHSQARGAGKPSSAKGEGNIAIDQLLLDSTFPVNAYRAAMLI